MKSVQVREQAPLSGLHLLICTTEERACLPHLTAEAKMCAWGFVIWRVLLNLSTHSGWLLSRGLAPPAGL